MLGDDLLDTLASANDLASRLAALREQEQARTLAEDTFARGRRFLPAARLVGRKSTGIVELTGLIRPDMRMSQRHG